MHCLFLQSSQIDVKSYLINTSYVKDHKLCYRVFTLCIQKYFLLRRVVRSRLKFYWEWVSWSKVQTLAGVQTYIIFLHIYNEQACDFISPLPVIPEGDLSFSL